MHTGTGFANGQMHTCTGSAVVCIIVQSVYDALVSGPTPNKALFKELVAPPWGILFDGSSVFSSHLR